MDPTLIGIIINQLMDRLLKGEMAILGKKKAVKQACLAMLDFSKLLYKVSSLMVEAMIQKLCLDRKLFAKKFASNWSRAYVSVSSLEKEGS